MKQSFAYVDYLIYQTSSHCHETGFILVLICDEIIKDIFLCRHQRDKEVKNLVLLVRAKSVGNKKELKKD